MKKIISYFLFVILFSFSFLFSFRLYSLNKQEGSEGKKVTQEWRDEILEQFDKDVSSLKEIIFQGESDKQEAQDFIELFKEQRDWFDQTVTGTRYFFDPKYNAVMQKKETIQRITKAQEKADEILEELVIKDEIGDKTYKKLRLIVLYDLNSTIQKEIEKGRANVLPTGIDESKIRDLVNKVVDDFKQKKLEEIDVETQVSEEVETLEKELRIIKRELEKQKREKAKIKKEVEEKLEEKNKAKLELEILLEKTKKNKERLKNEALARANKEATDALEEKNKKNLDLQIKLKRLEKEMEWLGKEVYFLQRKAEREVDLKREAERKSELTQEVARRKKELSKLEVNGIEEERIQQKEERLQQEFEIIQEEENKRKKELELDIRRQKERS